MSQSTTDPFHPAHADLLSTLQTLNSLISSHARIASSSASSSAPELKESTSDLNTALSDAQADLDDLSASVEAVTREPSRFGLDRAEVEKRGRMVDEVRGRLREVQGRVESVLANPPSGSGGVGQRQGQGQGRDQYPPDFDDEEEQEDEYSEWESQRQEQLFSEQDEQLEGVGHTIGNLRAQADDMGREIGQQTMELEEVDTVVDRVGGKIKTGRERVGEVLRRGEDRCGGCCIGVLIVALIILLVLALVL